MTVRTGAHGSVRDPGRTALDGASAEVFAARTPAANDHWWQSFGMTEPLHRTVAARTEASRHTHTVAASVSFVTAVTIVIGIHEFSHAVAGTALGYGNTLYPFG